MRIFVAVQLLLSFIGACGPSNPGGGGDGGTLSNPDGNGGYDGSDGDGDDMADPGVWLGPVQFGTDNNDGLYGAIVDSKGAVTAFGSVAAKDADIGTWFVARLSPSGRRVWTAGGPSGAAVHAAVGPNDELYIAGEGGLARLDDQGNTLWLLAGQFHIAQDVAVGPDGDVYASGLVSGTLNDTPGATTLPSIGALGDTFDGWIARLSPDGKVKWQVMIGSALNDWVATLAVGADGDVYAAGPTRGTIPGAVRVGGPGMRETFLMRMAQDGTVEWCIQLNDVNHSTLRFGPTGDLFLAGGPVARFDTSGKRAWLTALPFRDASDLALDGMGRVWIAGPSRHDRLAYASVLDDAGKLVATRWLAASPTSGPTSDPGKGDFWPRGEIQGAGIAVDRTRNAAYLVGELTGELPNQVNASSMKIGQFPGSDSFVAKLDMSATVERVDLVASPATLPLAAPGASAIVTATPRDAHGAPVSLPIAWSSSSPAVANIDASGAVRAVAAGRTYATPKLDLITGRITGAPAAVHVGEGFGTVLFGTPHGEVPRAVALDGDAVLVGGWTDDAFDGQELAGSRDAFLARLDARGQQVWMRQTGGAGADGILALATDGAGNNYTVTATTLAPGNPDGAAKIVVASRDRTGAERWSFEPGWAGSQEGECGVAVDGAGNTFVTCPSMDLITETQVLKLDPAGKEVWRWKNVAYQVGFLPLSGTHIAIAPGGEIIVAGMRDQNQFVHGFALAVDPAGTSMLWIADYQIPQVRALALDKAGNMYLGGAHLDGILDDNSGPYRGSAGYVVRVSLADRNKLVWRHIIGPHDGLPMAKVNVAGLAVDDAGNVYGAGAVDGPQALEGQPAGASDALVFRLDPADGKFVWKRQLGTSDADYGTSIAVRPAGDVVVAGYTFGPLDGNALRGIAPRKVNADVFVAAFGSDGARR